MSKKKSFVMYLDRKKEIDMLTDEQAGELLKAIFNYADSGEEPDFSELALTILFSVFKSQMDLNYEKYVAKTERNRKYYQSKKEKSDKLRQSQSNSVCVTADETVTETENNAEETVAEQEPETKPVKKKQDFSAEFDEVWNLYPKKQGKKQAENAYEKARKAGVEKETIINGIQAYCENIREKNIDQKYIKHGSTWFNQECWNDVYDMQKQQNQDEPDLYEQIWDSL